MGADNNPPSDLGILPRARRGAPVAERRAMLQRGIAVIILLAGCNRPLELDGSDGGADLARRDLSHIDLSRPPFTCGASPARFAGSLCGPPSLPCVVRENQTVASLAPNPPVITSAVPELAVDSGDRPWLLFDLYTTAAPGFQHLAHRNDSGDWSFEAPAAQMSGLLAIDPTDRLHALLLDGSDALYSSRSPTGSWDPPAPAASGITGFTSRLTSDSAGCLYAAVGENNELELLRWNGSWSSTPVFGRGWYADVALAASGQPQVVGTTEQANHPLEWAAPPGAAEVVDQEVGEFTLGVAGEQPHVLLGGDGFNTQLRYATRSGGKWSTWALADDSSPPPCAAPTFSGQSCTSVTVTNLPVAVVTASSDVRLLYLRIQTTRIDEALCPRHWEPSPNETPDLGLSSCIWNTTQSLQSSQLHIAWPSPNGVESAVLMDGLTATGAHAVLDSGGRIQLATTDYREMRWIVIGP
jgi:hypothetical protein